MNSQNVKTGTSSVSPTGLHLALSRFLSKFPSIFLVTFIWEFPLPPGTTQTNRAIRHVHLSFNKLGNLFRGYKITAIFTIYRGVTSPLCFSTRAQTFPDTCIMSGFPALWNEWQFVSRSQIVSRSLPQRFSGLRAGGLNAVRPFFSFFFFPPAWNVLQLSTRFVRLSFSKQKNSELAKRLEANVMLIQCKITKLHWERLASNEHSNRWWGESFRENNVLEEGGGGGREIWKSRRRSSDWIKPVWEFIELHLIRCPE